MKCHPTYIGESMRHIENMGDEGEAVATRAAVLCSQHAHKEKEGCLREPSMPITITAMLLAMPFHYSKWPISPCPNATHVAMGDMPELSLAYHLEAHHTFFSCPTTTKCPELFLPLCFPSFHHA